jgi:hypothetical protein
LKRPKLTTKGGSAPEEEEEELVVLQIVNKFPAFYGTQMFITTTM